VGGSINQQSKWLIAGAGRTWVWVERESLWIRTADVVGNRVQAKAGETKGRMVWCDREAERQRGREAERRQMCTEEEEEADVGKLADGLFVCLCVSGE
jgi:hypothetical protein